MEEITNEHPSEIHNSIRFTTANRVKIEEIGKYKQKLLQLLKKLKIREASQEQVLHFLFRLFENIKFYMIKRSKNSKKQQIF